MTNSPNHFNKFNAIFIGLLLVASIAFGFRYFFQNANQAHNAPSSTAPLFAASFPNEKGQIQYLKQYAGKIVVLNFWATWCEPCREEMPELSALHQTYQGKNVVVLGLAIDDVATIAEFLKETKVSYPLFAAEMQGMEIANNLGNDKGVLPYTVIIRADGSVAKTYFGRVSKALLEETLVKLL
jgi:thiol-disulfide isomerase/thioredoxin